MPTKKIISIAGARPQFIKTAIMHLAIASHTELEHRIVHTGQHYDAAMSGSFFHDLNIPEPAYNLGINQLSHGAMTGRMLETIETVLLKERPAMVIVYGDTNSTLAGALAARKLHIPVAHIEAGLRSFDMNMPEEVNRVLTDRISDLLFCPTRQAVLNLEQEGYRHLNNEVDQPGDIMFDAALHYSSIAQTKQVFPEPFILATIHREAALQSPAKLERIMQELNQLHQHTHVLFAAHPHTRAVITALGTNIHFDLLPPFGYLRMLQALEQCSCVVTDSGGLQKEAYFFSKPCITVRDSTEWTELTDAGVNVLWKEDGISLHEIYTTLLRDKPSFNARFYGTGNSCGLIVGKMIQYMERNK